MTSTIKERRPCISCALLRPTREHCVHMLVLSTASNSAMYEGEMCSVRNLTRVLLAAEDLLKAYCSFASFGAREVRKGKPEQASEPYRSHT